MKRVLTIGGSDPFAGGGIQSDLKTFENYQLFGLSALTCVGFLDEQGAFQLENLSPRLLKQQLASLTKMTSLDGIKLGLLHSEEAITIVRDFLIQNSELPVVLDPVLAFKETKTTENKRYMDKMISELFPLATVITPNLKEAALLANQDKLRSLDDLRHAAQTIHALGAKQLVIKGGQGIHGDFAIDLFFDGEKEQLFTRKKLTKSTVNGAGCTFSSAILANLCQGNSLPDAIATSKDYVYHCIEHGILMNDGSGSVWSGGKLKEE
ncbi:bifunctional hydroxymethylpyrimidine kinase/phosphomethylpyrimidine kinase [Enterococcus thailandicus]|uniref:pyridoxal kinase n=1 Tax=Enterococcus thailandicus TaxID=417368 RepID=A0A179ET86_ENTTH|nr:bifunctional hydroxymethylpyrimidine kinase/phosphomethylpyrimidine kinase [Enterococcus thailandicus]MDT2750733.1 bifunctional hydroxymethylpyrimidine kinase/phosphomethylpyrimidine kinase [Enterococcus thailandicus]MDT2775292.1 bifunctional hydroxymethylpyrimidine kinase/phosphomethylpyrimidine kinase [Enterococcus thailandicus]MDT2793788.1 bifunctional hydroxymethylpyrimidine kinase/phosphomethylpyrimidine kinase [Enterococcus thailandicus]OAQ56417.1 hydroxymethylpyrimidine/phosphomethylp